MRRDDGRRIGSADPRGGFTLIELLVVTAIIALLLAVFALSVWHVKEVARSTICLKRTHGVSEGYTAWVADNSFKAMGYNRDRNTTWWDWSDELAPYVKRPSEITFCPKVTEFTAGQRVVGSNCLMGGQDWAWRHKPPNGAITYEGSYGLNEWILHYETDTWAQYHDPGRTMYFGRYSGIADPSQTPILGDACWYGGWPKHTDVLPPSSGKAHGQPATSYDWPWSGSANNMERWCVPRHNGAVNIALADGSSRSVAVSDLWGLKWNKAFDTDYQRPAYP